MYVFKIKGVLHNDDSNEATQTRIYSYQRH